MNTLAITSDLLRLMETGTEQGRRNAVRVLESSPEPERVRPALRALFEKAGGRLRETCLRSLLELGGEQDSALLKEVLAGEDSELAGLALQALTDTRNAEAAPQVRKLLSSSRTATVQARGLIAYFEAMPELVTKEDLTAFVAIATGGGSLETRIAVVDAIPRFQPSLNSDLRRAFEPLVDSRDKQLKEAALVALASLGDKSSKKTLLEEYDELVDRNDRWSEAYFRRAEINRRIGDHDAAIKDYLKALNVAKNDPTLQPNTYVGLARSYTHKGKYKDAAEWLRKAPISMAELANLAEDPEFGPLRESRYGKDVFKEDPPDTPKGR
jgi:tetratricopeptide (TPR) repeat protein